MIIFNSETMNLNISSAVAYLTFKEMAKYDFLNHAFSTRLGGVSKGPFCSMNLSHKTADSKENVQENQKLFCEATGFNEDTLVKPIMSHGNVIGVAKKENIGSGEKRPSDFPNTDGLITNTPGVTLVTSHADCPVIFILAPKKRAIGLVHAGWRGTVKEIPKEAVNMLISEFGSDPTEIVCCIGPSICKDCFAVKNDVAEKFRDVGFININRIVFEKNGVFNIDLNEANKQTLIKSGVKEENIIISDICTKCNKDMLFSHRAVQGGDRGGMLAMMSLKV